MVSACEEERQKRVKGCKNDSVGTTAQAVGRRYGSISSEKNCEKGRNYKKKDVEVKLKPNKSKI